MPEAIQPPNFERARDIRGVLDMVRKNIPQSEDVLRETAEAISLIGAEGVSLADFTDTGIRAGGINFSERQPVNAEADFKFEPERLAKLLNAIKAKVVRLNHIGINYACADLDQELADIKAELAATNPQLRLYEEPAGREECMRWLFVGGDVQAEPTQPIFEIALAEQQKSAFQIDFDTSLTASELQEIWTNHFPEAPEMWQLKIRDSGVVLKMGQLGGKNGLNYLLGLGTDIRDTAWHRTGELKPLN